MSRTALYISDNGTIKWEHGGKLYCLHIQRDSDPENPRNWEGDDTRLTTMACWHRRYNLGDTEVTKGLTPEDFWEKLVEENVSDAEMAEAAMAGRFPHIRISESAEKEGLVTISWLSESGKVVIEELTPRDAIADAIRHDISTEDCLILMEPHAEWMPIWIYEHSGITISCGDRAGQYADRWDSGQLGFIVMLKKKAMKDLVEYVLDEKGECIPDGKRGYKTRPLTEETWRARAIEVMKDEVETYDQFLTGEVFGFTLYEADPVEDDETPDWEETDSCWGFFGDDLLTNGILDHVGHGLQEAIAADNYEQGEAVLHTAPWYEF